MKKILYSNDKPSKRGRAGEKGGNPTRREMKEKGK